MVGLGKWSAGVKTMFFSGSGTVEIFDNNGKYGFRFDVEGFDGNGVKINSVKEDGNTLIIAGEYPSIMPGKEVVAHITFEGDTLTGFAQIPLLGKIKIADGHKIG